MALPGWRIQPTVQQIIGQYLGGIPYETQLSAMDAIQYYMLRVMAYVPIYREKRQAEKEWGVDYLAAICGVCRAIGEDAYFDLEVQDNRKGAVLRSSFVIEKGFSIVSIVVENLSESRTRIDMDHRTIGSVWAWKRGRVHFEALKERIDQHGKHYQAHIGPMA